jgi:hypothetical protein
MDAFLSSLKFESVALRYDNEVIHRLVEFSKHTDDRPDLHTLIEFNYMQTMIENIGRRVRWWA